MDFSGLAGFAMSLINGGAEWVTTNNYIVGVVIVLVAIFVLIVRVMWPDTRNNC